MNLARALLINHSGLLERIKFAQWSRLINCDGNSYPAQRTIERHRQKVDLRGRVSLTRHIHRFDIPVPQSTTSNLIHPDKAKLRETILVMCSQGMSYRKIGVVLGIHWMHVGQIVKSTR